MAAVLDETGRPDTEKQERERWHVLRQLEGWIDTPMQVLSFVWLALLLVELIWSSSGVFKTLGTVIWVIFILEFALRFTLAPRKKAFLRENPLTLIALLAPAFRFLTVLRFLRFAHGFRLVRVVAVANQSLTALQQSFGRRGFGYVFIGTGVVVLLGAAGMLAFEPASQVKGGFTSYWDALWWTAMLLTTIGSQYWPVTAEGRVLAVLMSIYGLGVFGYITASFASFFVGQEAASSESDVVGQKEIAALRREIRQLRREIRATAPSRQGAPSRVS